MGNKQSKAFQEGLEAMVESLANEEQERLDREAVAAANGEPNKDTEKENATLEKDETKDKKEQELSNKFIFNESYTELRVTNQKQYLKWRTVNLVHKGRRDVKASLDRYQIRIDKIYGLTSSEDGLSFTIHALSRRDDACYEQETLTEKLKRMGRQMSQKAYSYLPWAENIWFQNEYVFNCDSQDQAARWLDELSELTHSDWSEKDMFVVMNVKNDRDAIKVLDSVLPMFEVANVNLHLKKTENVQEVLYTTNRLLEYKNLLIIGSDKTLHEAINGMLTRPDWLSIAALCKITVIPCGSGNVLSKNLGVTHPYLAALTSIRGTPQPMDVMSVSNPSGYRLFSYLSLNWGLISDIQAEKKDFDWTATRFGILRALPMILSPKIYQGTLHYLPAKSASANSVPDSVQTHTSLSEAERLAHPGPMDQYNKVDVKFLPEEWKTLSAAFSVFMAQNLQWTNKKLLTAPLASSTDGAMDLVFTQSGVLGLLAWLLFPNKAFHIRLPNWSFERARAFILEPNNDLSGHAGHLVVDNQEIPYSTIRCEVHKGLLQVITPVRKVESQEAKAKILQEKWDQLAAQKRWDLVSFESYQQWLSMYWIGAFAFLVLVLAVALQL